MKNHPSLIKAYKKSYSTIESCHTEEQLNVASKLVKNFKKMYKLVGYPEVLSYSLDRKLKQTYFRITKQYPLKQ